MDPQVLFLGSLLYVLCDSIQSHGFTYHLHADKIQISVSA